MRRDFEYVPVVTLAAANAKARRRAKKSRLVGALVFAILTGFWRAGIALFGLLAVTNIVQIKKTVKPHNSSH